MAGPLIIYVHDLRTTGVVGNAIAIAKRVAAKREVILCAGPKSAADHGVDPAPARLVVLRPSWLGRNGKLSGVPGLRTLIRETDAAAVLSAGNLGGRCVFWATRGLPIRTAYRISNAIGRPKRALQNWIRNRRHRQIINSASRLILVGYSIASHPDYAKAVESGLAVEIPNGVDVESARQRANAPSPHPWLDEETPVVLAIGRLHPQKNFPLLIAASAIAMKDRPHRLIIVGSGPGEVAAALREQAEKAGIADNFLLAGHQDNVFAWLTRAKLFALVSKWEGSSNALLEAMAVGTPVLASRQAGDAVSVLGDGQYGRLVDGNDVQSVAAGLVQQLNQPVLPGNRVNAYRLDTTLDHYANVLTQL